MKSFKRRTFLKTAALGSAALSSGFLSSCSSPSGNPSVQPDGKVYEWKMVTAWPPNFPIFGESVNQLVDWIGQLSGGRLRIKVYAGGELIPPLETFDAVSQGMAEMGHSVAYYWAGKIPSAQLLTSIPFGMNSQQLNSWFYYGGGLQLWEELYAPFNIVPMPAGNTGGQMGGWFNREINSVSDVKGLKMRMAGLGGKVLSKAGASALLVPGQELYTNLERGVIDSLEWVGPYHDYTFGFNRIAKYYYYPGWQEPTGALELAVNKSAFDSLPDDLKTVIRTAASSSNLLMLSQFELKNSEMLSQIRREGKVQLKKFPDEVLNHFRFLTSQVIQEITSKDKMAAKIYDSYSSFHKQVSAWNDISEKNHLSESAASNL
jgi:TRAP-type mannitol/chloroaromatic compound transport system substrate-binding protein